MSYTTITYTVKEQIAFIELARPEKRNAISIEMFKDIDKVIKNLKKDKTIRAAIVSGQGEDFCSGLDVKSVLKSPSKAIKLLFKWLPWQSNLAQRVSTKWRELPIPVIVAIHGRCWGGGLQIAQGGDFRIATPDASLSIMEGKWGLIPDMGGSIALRESVSIDVAKELAMTAKTITGEEALSLNMVTHNHEKPLEAALKLANEIKLQSPDAIAQVKKLYNKSWSKDAGMALARESWYQIKILTGKNFKIKTYNQTHDKSEHKTFKNRR